jgi:phosphoribosylamine--glycine ligase
MTEGTRPGITIGAIGKDGRTDAIAAACAASPLCAAVYALTEVMSPGLVERCDGRDGVTVVADICDLSLVRAWAERVKPSLVIIGPEEPLAAGAVDLLQSMGIPCFGPTQNLAQIESSKTWARRLVSEHGIPGNPDFWSIDKPEEVEVLLATLGEFVIKADGLKGGKGVRVYPEHFASFDEALQYAAAAIGEDGSVLIEERLEGEEFSLMTITDGIGVIHCPVVQDHKRALEGDTGPNTGGMGSYSCKDHSLPFLSSDEVKEAQEINRAVIQALEESTGERYHGVLYGGFMVTASGVRLIEYNCRFGDPEVLNVLPLLKTDFVELASAVTRDEVKGLDVRFDHEATVCKYVVPEDYPNGKGAGEPIRVPTSVESDPNVRLYWAAATLSDDGETQLTGSRALAIVGIGHDLETAERRAENAAALVKMATSATGGKVRYRHDIGTQKLVAQRVEHMRSVRSLLV